MRLSDRDKRLPKPLRCILLYLLLAGGLSAGVQAADPDRVIQHSRGVEKRALAVLGEHFRFEESLLTPDNDKLLVFFSVPDGASVILTQVSLRIDGKVTTTYAYSGSELISLQKRSTQLLHIGNLPTGEHTIQLDVKVMQGKVRAMKDYHFLKDDSPKFIELQLAGYDVREVVANEW